MNNQMTLLGDITPKNVIHKNESHKLANAFPVEAGKVIVEGQQVVILPNGNIRGFEAADNLNHIIGIAINGSAHAAYGASLQHGPVDVTVFVRGYAITYGFASEAINAGPVKPNGTLDATLRFSQYAQAEVTDPVIAIALNPAELGELVQLLIL